MIKQIRSYNARNSKFKKLGDYALVLLMAAQTVIAAAPQEVLSLKQSYWVSVCLTLSCVTIKFWCNIKDKV